VSRWQRAVGSKAWSGGLVVALAIVARLLNLGSFSMGHSELAYLNAASDLFAGDSDLEEARAAKLDLDQLVTWGCSRLAHAELARRLASVAFGVLTVLWLWRWTLARRGPMPALFVGLLAALSPLGVRYSQEIGPYAMGTFFAVVAVSSLDLRSESPGRRAQVGLGAGLVGTALSWPLLLVVLGPTLALLAPGSTDAGDPRAGSRRRYPAWWWTVLLAAVTAGGLLAANRESAAARAGSPAGPRWTAATVAQRFEELTVGALDASESPTPTGAVTFMLLALGAGAALGTTTGRAILCGALAGTVGIEAILWFHSDSSASRHLLGSLFVLILVAAGAHRVASAIRGLTSAGGFRRIASITVAAALVAPLLAAQYHRLWLYYVGGRPHWEWIARVVDTVARPDDEILATDESTKVILDHYLAATGSRLSSQVAADGSAWASGDRPRACTVIIGGPPPRPKETSRSGDRWRRVAADAGAGARVFLSGPAGGSRCRRPLPLELRKGPGSPLRGMLRWQGVAEDEALEFDAATRPYLTYGWSRLEEGEGKTFAWVEGRHAAVDLDLRAASDRLLILDLWPLPVPQHQQGVEILVNGALVASEELHPGGERLTVEVPAALLREGENRIAFGFRYAVRRRQVDPSSEDSRRVAAAFDRLELRPAARSETTPKR
jgi:hypothetical protein